MKRLFAYAAAILLVVSPTAVLAGKPAGAQPTDTAPPAAAGRPAPPPPLALPEGPQPSFIFCENAVLQRDMKVPVWGFAEAGADVTVSFAGQAVSGKADKDGRWHVELAPMKAEKQGRDMTVASGGKTVTIKSVHVGDVWFCAGQSNMDLPFAYIKEDPKETLPDVYLMSLGTNKANVPVLDIYRTKTWPPEEHRVTDRWEPCTPEFARNFSMVGYYFARVIGKDQNVPLGVINVAVGTSTIGQWCSVEADAAARGSKPKAVTPVRYIADDAAVGKKGPVLYNGLVNPFVGMAMKGMLWYQGESEAAWFFNAGYDKWFVAMFRDLRARWGLGDFPFLFVQEQAGAGGNDPAIRELQTRGLQEPNTAMAVIADVCRGLHPRNKQPVGERLALAAKALAYGQKIEYMGPLFKGFKVEGNKVRIEFDHVGGGLMAKDGAALSKAEATPVDPKARGPIAPFLIAGADGVFYPAAAVIDGQSVVVSNPIVTTPIAVRYGYSGSPTLTLYNKEGLPASPFRTDADKPLDAKPPAPKTAASKGTASAPAAPKATN